jgi:D-inositol-3-phosphate glycosyltransferase
VKIVIFGPAYPFRGGIAQFSGVLATSLRRAGHDVTLVNFRKQFPKFLFPGTSQFDESPQALKLDSVRTFTLWSPLSWWRTAREIKRANAELILCAWWMPFFGAGYWAVARLMGAKQRSRLCYLLHNVIPHERRIGDLQFSRLALGSATRYLALSQAEEREMRAQFPAVAADRIYYSPHPIYDCYAKFDGSSAEARAKLKIDARKLLLFFGFVREYKGLDILLRALPEVRKRDPEVKLAIVGEFYQDRGIYERLIDETGARDAVIVKDSFVGGDEVGVWFAAADCVVLPYRSATQSGIIPVAYALGTPVITTNVGGLGEVVQDGAAGFVVPPEDSAALAGAVARFYAAGGRAAFEANVQREAHRFSWEGMVETIERIAKDAV